MSHTDIKGWIRKHPYWQGDHCNAQQLTGKKELVNTALKPTQNTGGQCLFNYITLRLQNETLCVVGMMTATYDVCWGRVVTFMHQDCSWLLTFNLNLIQLFWPFVTYSAVLIWDHTVSKLLPPHPPTHTTGQATLKSAKLSFIKEDSMLFCHTFVLWAIRLYFNNLYIMPPNSVTNY